MNTYIPTKQQKHKTTKKIYRVSTENSVVDVTEDHSLLDNELNEISKGNIKPTKIEKNNINTKVTMRLIVKNFCPSLCSLGKRMSNIIID